MTDQQLRALLQAVLDDPADDDRRLVYADALEDAGYAERAELIRVQVALEKTPRLTPLGMITEGGVGIGGILQVENPDWGKLSDRENSLLFRLAAAGWDDTLPPNSELIWRRGFIAEVKCPSVVWIHYGPQLVREHPVEKVVDSEMTWPAVTEESPITLNPWHVPIELRDHLKPKEIIMHAGLYRYRSRQEALDDYSSACLKFAKSHSAI